MLRVFPSIRALRVCAFSSCSGLRTLPPHKLVGLPALSPTMQQGVLVEWLKKEGEVCKAGDVVAKVETDKACVSHVPLRGQARPLDSAARTTNSSIPFSLRGHSPLSSALTQDCRL